jgi:ferredoxin
MERAKADQSQFAAYTRAQTVKTKTLVDAKQHSTLCAKCVYVCHKGCLLPPIAEKGVREFLQCQCMAGTSHCTDCPGKCSHEVRVVASPSPEGVWLTPFVFRPLTSPPPAPYVRSTTTRIRPSWRPSRRWRSCWRT